MERSEFAKSCYRREIARTTHAQYNTGYLWIKLFVVVRTRKNRCNVCFSGNCFSREKTVTSSAHTVVFNIYMYARRTARTNRVVDFDFAFFSVELIYWQKRKIAARIHENLRSEFFKMRYNAFVKSRVELKIWARFAGLK